MLKKIWFHSFIFIHFVWNFVSHTKVPVFSEICLYYKGWESSDHFWGNWAQNGLPDITLEQRIQFSQATPHFVWDFVSHTRLPVYFKNLALLGTWYLVTTFGAIRPKWFTWHYSGATHSIFTSNPSFCSKFCFAHQAASLFRNLALLGALNLVTTFRAIGPKMVYLTLLWSHTLDFHKQQLILFGILFYT